MKLFELQEKLSKLKCFTPIDIKRLIKIPRQRIKNLPAKKLLEYIGKSYRKFKQRTKSSLICCSLVVADLSALVLL